MVFSLYGYFEPMINEHFDFSCIFSGLGVIY